MASSPPPVRFKLLLFGVFVALVAVVTFMVLYMLKPFENRKHPASVAEQESPAEETGSATVEAKADSQPAKAGPQKAAASDTAAAEDQEPDAPEPPPAAEHETKASIGAPSFEENSGKWQITFKSDSELKCKHFTLEDPARLVLDFPQTTYSGSERLLDSPIPFISKIRVGEKPEYTRYVIDISGDKVPGYEVTNQKEGVVIVFGK